MTENSKVMGKVLADNVIELPVVTEIDYEAGLNENVKKFGKFGCSAVGKVLDNGDMVVGRSYDLFYGNNPAYIIRTAVPGFNKTVGLVYNTFDGRTFDDVKVNGLTQDEIQTLIFFNAEIMNEKGFYIEANMRPKQPEDTGIAISTGTNPSAEVTVTLPAFVRYLGERCATVDEAIKLANTLNVCAFSNGDVNWCGGYFLADESGHFGVLELVDNKLIWNDMQNCQTNFYINEEYRNKATLGTGLGRYELLRSEINQVNTADDMTALMKRVRYTQILDPANCAFNPCSECCGEPVDEEGNVLTLQMCADGKYDDAILKGMEESGAIELAKSLEERKAEGTQWVSAWQTTANCNKRSIKAVFFEEDDLTFDLAV